MEHAALRMLSGTLGLTLLLTVTSLVSDLKFANALSPCAPTSNCSFCERFGDIRLVGGEQPTEGRVEFCYNNTWGTVCDNGFGVPDATVVCRQLGFSDQGALSFAFAVFGQGTGPIVLDDVVCNGDERRLIDCGHDGLGQHSCVHAEDVGVRCMIQSIGTTSVSLLQTTFSLQTSTSSFVSLTSTITSTLTAVTLSSSLGVTSERTTSAIVPSSSTSRRSTVSLDQSSLNPVVSDSSVAVVRVTSPPLLVQSTQLSGRPRQSSVTVVTTPPVIGPNISPSSANPGLIVGLVFLFLVLMLLAIIFILLLVIYLRKKNEKEIKNRTRMWYVQANPIAQASSFEGDSIFNLLEQNGQNYGTGPRDSTPPDFLVVRHRLPMSTVPNAYNTTPAPETKSISVNKGTESKTDKNMQRSGGKHYDSGVTELSKSPPQSSGIIIDSNDIVTYTDITFKSTTPESGTVGDNEDDKKRPLSELEEESGSYDESEWSEESWDEQSKGEDGENMEEVKKDVTYAEVKF